MVSRRGVLAAGAAALIWPGVASAQSGGKRLALVIGNDAYSGGMAKLNSPGKDADAVASVLRLCGFTTTVEKDANQQAMTGSITDFADALRAEPESVGFFYYSGHGAAAGDGANHMIPSGAHSALDERLWAESVRVDWLLQQLAGQGGPRIVALDCCRSALPIELRTPSASATPPAAGPAPGSFSNIRGFQSVVTEANQFISFAAWEGQTAIDTLEGQERGPYSIALEAKLKQGGRKILRLFDDVCLDVKRLTGNRQEPMNLVRLDEPSRNLILRAQPGAGDEPAAPPKLQQALVISCGYDGTNMELPGTAGDGDRIKTALAASDFDVRQVVDPPLTEFLDEVRQFKNRLEAAGDTAVGVVYFAGIGASEGDSNYLIPEGELPRDSVDLMTQAVPLRTLIRTLESTRIAAVVVLIDCGRVYSDLVQGKRRESGFGEQFGAGNVLLAHATAPGEMSQATSAGSPYSIALSEEIVRPERRSLEQVIAAVQARVRASTNNRMNPYMRSTIPAPIYFRDGTGLDVSPS